MTTPQAVGKRAPVFSLLASLDDWRRSRKEARRAASDLECCSDDEIARMAGDMKMSTAELHRMARSRRDAANLLLDRLAALHLDPANLARREPAVMCDLQRLCSGCRTKRRCRRELAQDPGNPAWREHCPNATTLLALQGAAAVGR